ncbi:hypothetical protein F5876DRAFT_36009 [Lentinula aff. lateritia]|uniref:Uncharacterized protein n=1 Tax=Lentinula aff. lateritia TaxID=2804960 RepID=A0ACC1U7H7_9AGAR|nr:hypothetical protein F5876DRAFT_36009 [Lentinula aff. lateritia]
MACCSSTEIEQHLLPARPINFAEQFWVEHSTWLESVGYRLRARYQPNRPPPQPLTLTEALFDPDELSSQGSIMDGIRISDNEPVMLKTVSRITHPQEVRIGLYFSNKDMASDPRNHCVPIYDVFPVPNNEMDIIVMPVLRPFDNPEFDTVGEVIAFIQQLFEGIQFMHEHLVAHGDCTAMNIMMDGSQMYPKGWSSLDPSQARDNPFRAAKRAGFRMQFWPKYYLIDFGLSHMYSKKSTVPPLERILRGGDKSAPEHAPKYKHANPFPTDIYYIGNLVRENFTERSDSSFCKRFAFLKPLVDSMIQDDPVKRPIIDEVVMQLDAVVRKHRRSVNFREAACDLQHFEFDDHLSALIRRFTKYLLMRRSLPVMLQPQRQNLIAYAFDIIDNEKFWVEHSGWLESLGYKLRSRYQPDKPPPQLRPFSEAFFDAEEKVSRVIHPQEVEIGLYFSNDSIAAEPRNHCVPIYDVIPVPNSEMDLIVMPVLRPFNEPEFDTVGEAIAFMQQLFEGIQFMHEHLVAHGDCTEMNIMMDGTQMFPEGWHAIDPWKAKDNPLRSAKRTGFRMHFWPKYYLIDFGLSHMYSNKSTAPPLERILRGGDKSAPEHVPKYKHANPFSTDIYYIGNLIRQNFTEVLLLLDGRVR